MLGTGARDGRDVAGAVTLGARGRGVVDVLPVALVLGLGGGDEPADAPVWLGVADADGLEDGVAVGDAVSVADGDVGDADGDMATVRVVAHGSPGAQRAPDGAAAVVSFAPAGAVVATVASNVTLAAAGPPGVPNAGTAQVSVLRDASNARPFEASSAVLLAMPALPSRPARSSTTVAPVGIGCRLRACNVYVRVVPGSALPPDAGATAAVTVSGTLADAADVAVKPANAATAATTAAKAVTSRVDPVRATRCDLPDPFDMSRPPRRVGHAAPARNA